MSQITLLHAARAFKPAILLPFALSLLAASGAAAAQCPNDDGVGNNSPATAEAIPAGSLRLSDRVIMGVGAATTSTDVGNDWFSFDLPAGASVVFDATTTATLPGLYMQLYTPSFSLITGTPSSDPLQEISHFNGSGTTESYLLRVTNGSQNLPCLDYELEVRSTLCPGDDVFAGLETCDTGLFLAVVDPIYLERLSVQDDSDDWYKTELLPNETLTVDIVFQHATADIDLSLRDRTGGSCGSILASSTSVTDNEMITYTNTSNSPLPLSIGATWYSSSAGNVCCNYEFYYEITPAASTDDAYEENDDICSSRWTPLAVYDDLNVSSTDSDFYYVDSYEGTTLTAAIDFDHASGDIDMRLWNIQAGCGNAVLVDSSASTSDYEEVSFLAGPTTFTRFVIEVYNFSSGVTTDYQLTVGEGFASNVGQTVCLGMVNSINRRGWTRGTGSASVADNDLTLVSYDLPLNSFGFFNGSMGYGFVANPAGSSGNLCIAGAPIGRFVGPGQIMSSGSNGEISLPLDLTALPQPSGTVPAVPGDTWFFQCWYRDAFSGTATSNFSGALRVRFE